MASNFTRAEQKIRKLARAPGNTICANCGNEKKFGWSSICIKFLTFVCNECKSSHQAISHRCKSITMSAWTDEEVDKLEQQGGNDVARRTWLKHAPPIGQGGRPQPGSDLTLFKSFVVDVYERRKYFGADESDASTRYGGLPAPSFASPAPAPVAVAIAPAMKRLAKPATLPSVIAAAPASAPLPPVMDLLDFSAPAPTPSVPVVSAQSTDFFSVNFDAFQPPPPPAQSLPPSASTSSGFSFLQPAVTSAPSTGSFTGLHIPATATATATTHSANSFAADFGTLSVNSNEATTASTATRKPIMGGSASATNSFAISSLMMGGPTAATTSTNGMMMNPSIPAQQQQNSMNPMQQQNLLMMQRQLMIQMNNGSMNPQQQQQMMMMMQQQQQMMLMNGGGMNQNFNNGTMSNGGMMQNFNNGKMGNGGMMQMNHGTGNGMMQMNYGKGTNSIATSSTNAKESPFPSNWP